MQLQTSKTNVIVIEVKDQIVSDLRMVNSKVMKINGKSISNHTYLPTNEHPFDHYLVYT